MAGIGIRNEFEIDNRGQKCLDNVYEVADSVNGAYLNITTALQNGGGGFQVFEGLLLYIAQQTSGPLASAIGNCSYVSVYTTERFMVFEDMFSSFNSLGDLAYSLIFGVMANMIKYRTSLVRISYYEQQNNTAGVYGEVLSALWYTIWFDNLFYMSDTSEVHYDRGAGYLDFVE